MSCLCWDIQGSFQDHNIGYTILEFCRIMEKKKEKKLWTKSGMPTICRN